MTAPIDVKILRLRQGGATPAYATEQSAGVDLVAAIDQPVVLQPGDRVGVPAGIAIELPRRDLVALIFARSGLAVKRGLALANGVGVVDADYRGEIVCGLINLGNVPVTITPGDRVAQLVIMPIAVARFVEAATLSPTARGEGGFGSTGTSVNR